MVCCNTLASTIDKVPRFSKPKLDSKFTSEWLELERGVVRYIKVGNQQAKETVVLMPDPPNTIEHLEELIKLLEPNFQVVVFEGVGFGHSRAFLSYNFSVRHNADVIIELLEKLNVNNAILALTCIAALPSLMVANKHPEIVSGLVLGQTPSLDEAKKWASRVDFKNVLATPFIGQIILRALRNKIADVWYQNALPKGGGRSSLVARTLASFKDGARFSLASAFQALQSDNTTPLELVASQQAIVLWGSLDRTHKKTNKQSIIELLPNGSIIELENCAHFPDIEAPEAFAKAIHDVSHLAS